jgi:CheY-specific phosphatase CheX
MDDVDQVTMTPLCEVREYLAEVTVELFEGYGMALEYRGADVTSTTVDRLRVAATIGFVGDKVRGALVMLTTLEAVCYWREKISGEKSGIEAVSDTIGEFANMLLGRLKYRLLLRGVVVLLATPTTAIGSNLTLPAPAVGASQWLQFDGEAGPLVARVDASFDADFYFGVETPNAPPACAGDMLIF